MEPVGARQLSEPAPGYYTSLAPFRSLFEQGNPILTYHKLGPRPPKVRLKGMYMNPALFRRQLTELRKAGWATGTLTTSTGPITPRRVVITFDDGYTNVLTHGLEPLAATGFKAVQFLVAGLLGQHNTWDVPCGEASEPMMDATQVREWLAAGHDIGSHTLTHPYLTRLPSARAREEITASRKKLEDLFGLEVPHFCYPYGDWNETVRDMVQAASYQTACTTDPGVNRPGGSPYSLRRFTARYATRNLKAIWARLRGALS